VQKKRLLQLLSDVVHVGELSRLLAPFSRKPTRALGRRELIEIANQTAGAGYRYPNPLPALEIALSLGFLRQSANLFTLTSSGRIFIEQAAPNIADLSSMQGRLLLGVLLDNNEIRLSLASLLREFRQNENNCFEANPSVSWESSKQEIAKILQQIGALRYREGVLLISPEFEEILSTNLIESAKLTEDALWKRLETQRLRAREVEQFVLAEERKRLVHLSRPDLAELVSRVSAEDVSAGYDIHSYEADGSTRYIEVKSSTGNQIRFIWSVGERRLARELGARYWIYFVPLTHSLPKNLCPILLIQDPTSYIQSGALKEEAHAFTVSAQTQRTISSKLVDSQADRMIQWPFSLLKK
jgi:hypothetical protein